MTAYDAAAGVRQFAHLGLAIESVELQVPIAATFSLGDAAKAHERLAKGHVFGKDCPPGSVDHCWSVSVTD